MLRNLIAVTLQFTSGSLKGISDRW